MPKQKFEYIEMPSLCQFNYVFFFSKFAWQINLEIPRVRFIKKVIIKKNIRNKKKKLSLISFIRCWLTEFWNDVKLFSTKKKNACFFLKQKILCHPRDWNESMENTSFFEGQYLPKKNMLSFEEKKGKIKNFHFSIFTA